MYFFFNHTLENKLFPKLIQSNPGFFEGQCLRSVLTLRELLPAVSFTISLQQTSQPRLACISSVAIIRLSPQPPVFESTLKLEILLQIQSVHLRRQSKLSFYSVTLPSMSKYPSHGSGLWFGGGNNGTLLSDIPTSKNECLFLS